MLTSRLDANRSKTPSTVERRLASRHKSYAEAWADPGGMEPAILCKIVDISLSGAKLAFTPGLLLPDSFVLHTGYTKHPARVVWRRRDQVGVEFDALAPQYRESDRLPAADTILE